MSGRRPIDLRLLAYFQATAEAGNITRAARHLNVAQPTLSKALRLLEGQLGVALFVREAHGVVPTAIGGRLLRHARLVTAQVTDALEEVESLRAGTAGQVRVGAGPSWVRRMLPEAVALLLADTPGIRVSVTAGFDERLLDRLDDGELDFVVAEKPLSGGDDDYYNYRPLTRDSLVVCARKDHPLALFGRVPLADALKARWALPTDHTLASRKLASQLTLLGAAPPGDVLTSSSLTFLLGFVLRSDALTYTTRSMLGTPEAADLAEIDLPELVSEREAGLIMRRGAALTPAADALATRLVEICRGNPVN